MALENVIMGHVRNVMSTKMPLNPDVLRWARETSGYSIEDIACKLKKSVDAIQSWEVGEASPTYFQLENLAYKIYKRPIAIFFFPEPPNEETPKQAFRSLPEYEIANLSPRMNYLIRKAYLMQLNLEELYEGSYTSAKRIINALDFNEKSELQTMCQTIRSYFKVDLKEQKSWKDADTAFKKWREVFEDHGINIFKESFSQRVGLKSEDSPISGFCLYHEKYPIIYVNNSKSKTRQIFTLFHELAHLLFGSGGIDTRNDEFIQNLRGEDKRVEILCNEFAGEFLVPNTDFDIVVKSYGNLSSLKIEKLAKQYCVSREVILRKLLDRGLVSGQEYKDRVNEWANSSKRKSSSGGGDYYKTQGVYLGEKYLSLVFQRYYQKRISLDDLSNYLGIKPKNFRKMEDYMFKQG